jgi:hypothetical protein
VPVSRPSTLSSYYPNVEQSRHTYAGIFVASTGARTRSPSSTTQPQPSPPRRPAGGSRTVDTECKHV